jgi:hypothetical protein
VEVSLKGTVDSIVSKVAVAEQLNHVSEATKKSLFAQGVLLCRRSCEIQMIASSYVDISRTHLEPRMASLATLMAVDPQGDGGAVAIKGLKESTC